MIELPADESLPDCVFTEDAAVVVGKKVGFDFDTYQNSLRLFSQIKAIRTEGARQRRCERR